MDFLVTKIREIHEFQPTEAILSHHKTGPRKPCYAQAQADDKGTTTFDAVTFRTGSIRQIFWTIIQTCTKQVSQHLQHHVTIFNPLRSLRNRKDTEISAQPTQPAGNAQKSTRSRRTGGVPFAAAIKSVPGMWRGEGMGSGVEERTCRYGD